MSATLKLAVISILVLIASGVSAGQVMPSTPANKAGAVAAGAASKADQTDDGTGEIPTFHAQARQVLVTVDVWKHAPSSNEWVPKDFAKKNSWLASRAAMPPIARGLSSGDFHVFDNGVEQKINYLQESDLPRRDASRQWFFYPQRRGLWGTNFEFVVAPRAPVATYTIGYTPTPSQSGDCHTLRVVAGANLVILNRDRYCTGDESDLATEEERKLAARMEQFAKSGKGGAFKVSIRPFVFWSSRVLSLLRDDPSGVGPLAAPAAADTYVVVVHDSKAPATVQIATQYVFWAAHGVGTFTNFDGSTIYWPYPCEGNEAVDVLGIVYKKETREVAARFGDTYSCRTAGGSSRTLMELGWGLSDPRTWVLIPTRFNSQVQLRPGDYDIHVVVSDGHNFGQARMPLHVEALDGEALTISDLAVNGIWRDASWVLRDAGLISPAPLVPSPLVSKHAQLIPVPDSRIPTNNRLPLYFEIYEPLLADQNPQVYFRMKITDLKHGTVVMNTEPTSAAPCVTPGNVVVPVALDVETEKLPKGEYKLEVQATDSSGRKTEWRMAKFEIQ